MNSKLNSKDEVIAALIESRDYNLKMEASAAKDYVKTNKREARDRSLVYRGKAEAMSSILEKIMPTPVKKEEVLVIPLNPDKKKNGK